MRGPTIRTLLAIACATAAAAASMHADDARAIVAERVTKLSRDSAWKPAGTVRMRFRTWHPQGLVKIGASLFFSSVEVRSADRREGAGHLFKASMSGDLAVDLALGEGAIFHPGGIDYDGQNIWVPVGEYRPDSRSIVYRVDPQSMKAIEVLRAADHIGAIVHDTDADSLHGVSWGSRRFYRWSLANPGAPPTSALNPSHYIDYQDCKYAGAHRMVCGGVAELRPAADQPPFRLGGIDLIDLAAARPIHQAPVPLWTAGRLAMTQNPVWLEPTATGLRAYFMPEDDVSTLYMYDVELP